jgi:hypothetical protein
MSYRHEAEKHEGLYPLRDGPSIQWKQLSTLPKTEILLTY